MGLIYKILPIALCQEHGRFIPAAVDVVDGFIHFSTREQLKETASKWFSGQRDLLLIAVDAIRLGEALRFEPSLGGALFPHLYTDLPLEAVVFAKPLPLLPDGKHDFAGLL